MQVNALQRPTVYMYTRIPVIGGLYLSVDMPRFAMYEAVAVTNQNRDRRDMSWFTGLRTCVFRTVLCMRLAILYRYASCQY